MSRDIHIHLKVSRRALVGGLVLLLLGTLGYDAISETFTMISYYPSPVGIYKRLTSTMDTTLARDGGLVTIGSSTSDSSLEVAGEGTFKRDLTAESSLEVAGEGAFKRDVTVAGDITASRLRLTGGGTCNSATSGMLGMVSGTLQFCDGTEWKPLGAPRPPGTVFYISGANPRCPADSATQSRKWTARTCSARSSGCSHAGGGACRSCTTGSGWSASPPASCTYETPAPMAGHCSNCHCGSGPALTCPPPDSWTEIKCVQK